MYPATLAAYCDAVDRIKRNGPCTVTNQFQDARELGRELADRRCLLHADENALLLLIPRHGAYHDCRYLARDAPALDAALRSLPDPASVGAAALPLRAMVIDREPRSGRLAALFRDQGFSLRKKLLRTDNRVASPGAVEAMRLLAAEHLADVGFATPDDAGEILALLSETFDLVDDSIPELDAIRENCARRQVTVLRLDGRIAALHYFTIRNSIVHGLFDVTRREYRGAAGLFWAVSMFEYDYFSRCSVPVRRTYGWRDATRTRLVKSSRDTNCNPDGVVIHILLRDAGATAGEGRA